MQHFLLLIFTFIASDPQPAHGSRQVRQYIKFLSNNSTMVHAPYRAPRKHPIWWHPENDTWETRGVAKLKRLVIRGFTGRKLRFKLSPFLFLVYRKPVIVVPPPLSSPSHPLPITVAYHYHINVLPASPPQSPSVSVRASLVLLSVLSDTLSTIFSARRGQLMRNPSCRVLTLRFSSRSPEQLPRAVY